MHDEAAAPPGLSWTRRLGAFAMVAATLGIWLFDGLSDRPIQLVIGPGLVLAGLAVLIPHALAQVLARGILWFHLSIATLGSLLADDWQPTLIGMGAGLALLSLGRGALGGGRARDTFAPIGLRRTLILAMVVGIVAAHSMALMALQFDSYRARQGVLALAFSGTAILSVIGIVRMRAWGVFLYLGTMLAAFGMAATIAWGGHEVQMALGTGWEHELHSSLWLVAAGALAIGAAPALFLRAKGPRVNQPAEPSEGLAHQVLVGIVFLVCAVGSFTPL